MATAAVDTAGAFKPLNETVDHVMNDEAEASPKRSSKEAENENEGPSSAKKRKAAPKAAIKGGKKGTAKKVDNVKEEAADEEEAAANPPATPAPKKAAKNAKTPESAVRKRATPKGDTASPRGIPKSWEEAGPADRMLHRMREDGKDWATVRKMWKDLTGEDTATSSLPNRYNRMKCNMMRLGPGHDRILLEVKAEVEAGLEASKWAQIVAGVKERSGTAYQTPFLQKNAKELEAKGGLAVPPEASEEEGENEASEGDESGNREEVKTEEEEAEAEDGAQVNGDEE